MTRNYKQCVNTLYIKVVNPTPLLTPQTSLTYHIKVLIDQMDLQISSPNLAGRLAHYEPNWTHITQD